MYPCSPLTIVLYFYRNRDLWIPQRRVRSGDVVEGGGSRHQPGALGAAAAGLDLPTTDEPFATVILCTADREKVDKRTRSKWSRVLRYAAEYKTNAEPLAAFIRRRAASTNVLRGLPDASGEVDDLAKRDSSDPAGRRQSPC